jgi:energy-coupling factor transporter ATP-binding protein EcfA2
MSLKPRCQVRGPPGSGKSTLSVLLHNYIKQKERSGVVIWMDSWHVEVVTRFNSWKAFLRSKGMEPGDGTILILDEAQSSYWDIGLWHPFLKPITALECNNRAIVFTSQGSATVNTDNEYSTSMAITLSRKVTLRPIDRHDGTAAIGLLLTLPEFKIFTDDLSKTSGFTKLDQTVCDWIYNVTAGHVGAAIDLLRFFNSDKVRFLEGHSLCIVEVNPSRHTVPSSIMQQDTPCITVLKILTIIIYFSTLRTTAP